MLRTTRNESWNDAWKSCWGCHPRMINAAVKSELRRSGGRFRAQPPMITVIMMVERMAEAWRPVATV